MEARQVRDLARRPDGGAARGSAVEPPDTTVFLERARILHESMRRHDGLTPGLRQGKTIQDLCEHITTVVAPTDVLLGRVTGFSEYFVRLLPEVQAEIVRRFGAAGQ